MPADPTPRPVLAVADLVVEIGGRAVVDGVSLEVKPGEVVALVGESGSGKSLTALSVIGLLPKAARAAGGRALLDGEDLLAKSEAELRAMRGRRLAMIFQEPIASLNPLVSVGDQVAESLIVHGEASPAEARRRAVEMLRRVGIPEPERRARQLPIELSGGMCQRVMIASALVSGPRLLIADEPTTALDVTVQAEVLDILDDLTRAYGMALMLVSHDLGVIARMCRETIVLYAGRRMENGETRAVLTRPKHPYTRGLIAAVPKRIADGGRLSTIRGRVPAFDRLPAGCVFSDRCPDVIAACHAGEPRWTTFADSRGVRCIRSEGELE